MNLSYDDYAEIGAAFISIVAAQHAMGHASPAGTARDYVDASDLTLNQALVRDAFAAAGSQPDADAAERVAAFVRDRQLLDVIADAVAR